ncbi:MAG: EAL domain-containing protein [Pseudomonadota bacterium]
MQHDIAATLALTGGLGALARVHGLDMWPPAIELTWLAVIPLLAAVWLAHRPLPTAIVGAGALLLHGVVGLLTGAPWTALAGAFGGVALIAASAWWLRPQDHNTAHMAELLDMLVSRADTGFILLDEAQVILYANSTAGRLVGHPRLAGNPITRALHCKPLSEFLDGQTPRSNFDDKPHRVHCLQRNTKAMLGMTARRMDWRGVNYNLIQLSRRDGQLKAQIAARKRTDDFTRLLDSSNDLLLTLNASAQIVWANAAVRERYARSLVMGTTPVDRLFEVASGESLQELCAAVLETDKPSPAIELALTQDPAVRLRAQIQPLDGTRLLLAARDMSLELKALATLADERAFRAQIMQSSPAGLLVLEEASGGVLEANKTALDLLGYASEELIGKSLHACRVFASEIESERLQQTMLARRQIRDSEATILDTQGTERRAEFSLRTGEREGRAVYFLFFRDITARHEAQQALRESEAKFSRIFADSPDGIAIFDSQTMRIIEANKRFAACVSIDRERAVGADMAQFVANEERLRDAAEQVLQSGSVLNVEIDLVNATQERQPSLLSISSIELGGVPVLLCIAKDIQHLRQTEIKLRRSEQRFRGTFENAPLGMLLADVSGHIFRANRFAADMLAYEETTLPGVHLSRLLPSRDRGNLLTALEQLMSGDIEQSHTERRLVSQAGVEIWVNLHVVLQRGEDGNPLYFIIQMEDITDSKHSQERMERLAFYDTLTGLANRRLFNDRLNQAVKRADRSKKSAALMYLDLDQFKRVNDTLGHDAGDALLKHVSLRLQKCVRKSDTVARPGGDEFTIILHDISTISDASTVAEKILAELAKPIFISGQQLVVTTSIGITMVPQDSNDVQTLMRNADMAMYKAKERGRNNYQFFFEDMNQEAMNRLKIESELREALKRNEFELFYQPKVRLKDHAFTGVECLIRWNHPDRGLLNPAAFIEIAEDTGVIVEIGAWVIEEASRIGKQLREIFGQTFTIAANISPRQFRDPNLVSTVRRALRETGLPPEALEIEITETMLMQDIEAASQTVQRITEIGVLLAIDDFGTGYSSLNYLKKFPINTVKVDRSFVMDIPQSEDDVAITSAVIAMAHQLNMRVVAEGVETPEQLNFLRSQNCEYAQGYLFGKPMPLDDLRRLVSSRAPVPAIATGGAASTAAGQG